MWLRIAERRVSETVVKVRRAELRLLMNGTRAGGRLITFVSLLVHEPGADAQPLTLLPFPITTN